MGCRPSLKHVRVFGCTAYVMRPPRPTKLEARGVEGVNLESLDHGVFRVLVNESSDENVYSYNIISSRHVMFDEGRFLGAPGLEHVIY